MNSADSIQAQPNSVKPLLHIHNEVEIVEKEDCGTVNEPISEWDKLKIKITDTLFQVLETLLIGSGAITCVYLFQIMSIPIFIFFGLLFVLDLHTNFLETHYSV